MWIFLSFRFYFSDGIFLVDFFGVILASFALDCFFAWAASFLASIIAWASFNASISLIVVVGVLSVVFCDHFFRRRMKKMNTKSRNDIDNTTQKFQVFVTSSYSTINGITELLDIVCFFTGSKYDNSICISSSLVVCLIAYFSQG